jgi:cytochrome c biogenesis protein CcmG/thiol:disulfide interchange protein DsbE
MPDLGPHAAFIWAAYAVTFVAVAGLVGLIVQDDRRQRQLLADLERQGITRRSAKPTGKPKTVENKSRVAEAEAMTAPKPRSFLQRWGMALPLLIFALLSGLFWYALHSGDPSRLPSALVGKTVPPFSLPPIEGFADAEGFQTADLAKGEPTIVNVWASWCVPCHEEHPLLLHLAKQPGVRLYGINYKDDPAAARRFLGRYGNPFARVGADRSGRVAIDWGVYGVPETYVIGGDGKIAFRHVGPLTEDAIKDKLLPLVQPTGAKPQG